MPRLNENDLAQELARSEGLKVQLPIGQVKEMVRRLLERLSLEHTETILGTVMWHHPERKARKHRKAKR